MLGIQARSMVMNLATSPFKDFRSNAGAAVAIGKWFTPGLGLRTKVQGIWGKRVRQRMVMALQTYSTSIGS
jgi:hypothetical protein